MAEIVDCACGYDHEVMPTADDYGVVYELVCRVHKCHIPCRRCDALDKISGITRRTGGYDDDF